MNIPPLFLFNVEKGVEETLSLVNPVVQANLFLLLSCLEFIFLLLFVPLIFVNRSLAEEYNYLFTC